jgi:competence protein ComEC
MHCPLFIISILFALGISLEKFTDIPFLFLYFSTLFVIALSFMLLRQAKQSAILILVFYFLLGGLFYKNAVILSSNHISNLKSIKNSAVFLKGIIGSSVEMRQQNRISKAVFVLDALEIKFFNNWYKTSGKVLVQSFNTSNNLSYGDYLILGGKLLSPNNLYFSQRLNYAQYLANQGISFIFSVKKHNLVRVISKDKVNFLMAISFKAKNKMQGIIRKTLPPLEAGILEAFILGERSHLPREINNLFVQTGTVHILAISGFNVGIVIFIILILLKILRIKRNLRFILTIIFIIIYAIITGSQPSVIRASIMAIVILIGILLQKESNVYNSISFAALIILMLSPRTLFNVGFQLSFISVISIVWLTKRIEKLISKVLTSKSRILTWVVRSISVSLAAWLGVLGLVVYYFNILSPVTILANLFIVPFSSLIVATGFCLIVVGGIFPSLSFIFASSVKLCLDILVYAVWIFHKLPAAFFYFSSISIYLVLAYYLVLFVIFSLIKVPSENMDN